jgi:hypothetical protein
VLNVNGIGSDRIVTKITVQLLGLNHTNPDDLDLLLVGPRGQTTILMSDAGGGYNLNGVNLTFSSTGGILPDSGRIRTGNYRPGNYGNQNDPFIGATTGPSPAWNTNLSIFNNKNPNGIWKLFVVDDNLNGGRRGVRVGSIANGWRLNITTVPVPLPPAVWLFGTAMVGLALIGRRSDMRTY